MANGTGMLGRGIAERMVDGRRDALEAVDLAPRHVPAAEVALEPRDAPRATPSSFCVGAGVARQAQHDHVAVVLIRRRH